MHAIGLHTACTGVNSRLKQLGTGANNRYRVFTRSSKRPSNFQQMYSKYTRIAGRLLDRVNTPITAQKENVIAHYGHFCHCEGLR